ncbi:CidA/LrgA family protein [Nioella nitratireducens]|uniref:CidA/LrgA family protein n=1 Tax=Nioella nitratireducens TaxID=1287720 RepID=UPI0008FD6C57|nr:CidA/LrgA family protein [Nioella nitratireducens]
MIFHITVLLVFQLVGEVISRALFPVLPGPVLGMVLLLAAMALIPRLATAIKETATGLLGHLSLLFVPAGVGVIGHMDLLVAHGVAIFAALVLSTVLAIAVGALVFTGVAKAMGLADD